MRNTLYLVIPCFNEEEILLDSAKILKEKIINLINTNKISDKSKIMFVDDGSTDKTWKIILELNKQEKIFTGIKLSKNEGHQNALLAGLLTAKEHADFTISMDADLQDDVDAIDEMIDKFFKGFEIVYGVRCDRQIDSFFKKSTANLFYKIMNLMGAKTITNHADFRLMSANALNALEKFNEVNIFLRGIIPLIGFKSAKVFYERKERKAGISKYPLKKMIHFAIDGITSCSTKPINLVAATGLLLTAFSIIIFIILRLKYIDFLSSFAMFSIWFIGGLNLIAFAIIGTYVGKIYLESKHRPKFIVEADLE